MWTMLHSKKQLHKETCLAGVINSYNEIQNQDKIVWNSNENVVVM